MWSKTASMIESAKARAPRHSCVNGIVRGKAGLPGAALLLLASCDALVPLNCKPTEDPDKIAIAKTLISQYQAVIGRISPETLERISVSMYEDCGTYLRVVSVPRVDDTVAYTGYRWTYVIDPGKLEIKSVKAE